MVVVLGLGERWGEESADRVGSRIEEGETCEFVSENLKGVLGEAVGEAAEGFVEGRGLEGIGFVTFISTFGSTNGKGVGDRYSRGIRRWGVEGFELGVDVVGWIGGGKMGWLGPWFWGFGAQRGRSEAGFLGEGLGEGWRTGLGFGGGAWV